MAAVSDLQRRSSQQQRKRAWCFTGFRVADEASYQAVQCQYMIYGRETCPDTQRKHLQGFVFFENGKVFTAVQKLFPTDHIEPAIHIGKAINYCKKEDPTPFQKGSKPSSAIGQRADDYGDIIDLAKQRKLDAIADQYPSAYVQQYRNINQIARDYRPPVHDLPSVFHDADKHHVWIHGPTGTGKSHMARHELYPGATRYFKVANKWWDNYDGEEVAVIDELQPHAGYSAHPLPADLLKQWADIYTFSPEGKGITLKLIRPKHLIVTSNYSIEEVYPAPEDHLPLRRRFRVELRDVVYQPPSPFDSGSNPVIQVSADADV